ncbi:hypothetical protein K505DRAFT_338961 [Melanomma pulvis-pyrius CBS 109.77]|uniref:C2H2-type domain-containing protein n=1 Tax=Melanomma pulvis-pyrius CBS 109.77 TaxID=1314802 RepID=A0A6A6X7L5_9PLEO|nr:hypothetical protein K505DRAFT_338961 [Melanomma pulvis-pyrius CBS 109.77]
MFRSPIYDTKMCRIKDQQGSRGLLPERGLPPRFRSRRRLSPNHQELDHFPSIHHCLRCRRPKTILKEEEITVAKHSDPWYSLSSEEKFFHNHTTTFPGQFAPSSVQDTVALHKMHQISAFVAPAPHISAQIDSCGRGFVNLTTALANVPHFAAQALPETINDEFDRFKTWAGNIGAHRKGHRSLEHMLRDAAHVKVETYNLLQALQDSLANALVIVNGKQTTWDELSNSDSDSESGSLPSGYAGDTSFQSDTDLKHISASIKNTVISNHAISLPSIIRISRRTTYFIQSKFPEANKILTERLGCAISGRLQYLAYGEERHQKLVKNVEKISHEELRTECTDNSTEASPMPTSYSTLVNATIRALLLPKEAREKEHFECPLCYMVVAIHTKAGWKYEHPLRRDTMMCPLCNKGMTLRAMQKHLGHHQEQLALFGLPLNLDEDALRNDEAEALVDVENWQDDEISDVGDTADAGDDLASNAETEEPHVAWEAILETRLGNIAATALHLHTEILPSVIPFTKHLLKAVSFRKWRGHTLSARIFNEVVSTLSIIETEGDARLRQLDLIKEAQALMSDIEGVLSWQIGDIPGCGQTFSTLDSDNRSTVDLPQAMSSALSVPST